MKGIILAGGTGSRLHPLTRVTNKHLLPVVRYPMVYHAVDKIAQAGIQDILVVTGTEHIGALVAVLGSGASLGLRFTYRVQEQAGGIAQALGLAEEFTHADRFVVVLGDNIFEDALLPFVTRFLNQTEGARVLLKKVKDPSRFGVAKMEGDRIKLIREKPSRPESALAVTGVYMYEPAVFDVVRSLVPSARGELEITDVNNFYAQHGRLEYDVLPGWWTDAGTFESLTLANRLVGDRRLSLFDRM